MLDATNSGMATELATGQLLAGRTATKVTEKGTPIQPRERRVGSLEQNVWRSI